MQLAYKAYGAGPPMIILHGLLGSADNWHTLSRTAFAPHFHVFAVDQRNHGRSPHSEVFDYPSMVSDLVDFMDTQGLTSAHLLGHSMGGKTVMHFALTHPERTESLIVADMAPKAYPPQHNALFGILRDFDLTRYNSLRDIDDALALQVPGFDVRQLLLKNLNRNAASGFSWKMNLDGIYRNYPHLIGPLDAHVTYIGPTLFIRGGTSPYVSDDDEDLILRYFPTAEVAVLDGAGHWLHADQPQAFADEVLSFLSV